MQVTLIGNSKFLYCINVSMWLSVVNDGPCDTSTVCNVLAKLGAQPLGQDKAVFENGGIK